jgi:hypothetical protein
MSEWIDVLGNADAPERRPDLFTAAFTALATTLDMDPDAADVVTDVLDRRLDAVPMTQQLVAAVSALTAYLGVDAAYLLQWLAYEDTENRLEYTSAQAPPAVAHFLRLTMARHGAMFDALQRVSVAGAGEEWDTIEKMSPIDMLSGTRTVFVRLTKLNGTTAHFACSNNSLLIITAHFLELVNAPQTMNGYDPSTLQSFISTLTTTVNLLTADADDDNDADPEAPASGDQLRT